MRSLFTTFAVILATAAICISLSTIGDPQQETPVLHTPKTGATLPATPAIFETSLQSRISSSDTSMTLVSTSTASGEVLPSGYHCFTVDEGRSDAEFVCGTLTSSKTVSGMTRGISYLNGTSTVSANQHAHRVGANVKATDFPAIQIIKSVINGEDTIPNLLTYSNTVLCGVGSATTTLCPKYYIDTVAVAGASNADESTKGISELATKIEQASSTATGSTAAALVLQAKYATSSFRVNCALCTVITQNDGFIAPWAISTTSGATYNWGASHIFASGFLATASSTINGTTTIAASSVTSKALVLNSLPYAFPSTAGASSSVLMTNGAGALVWDTPRVQVVNLSTHNALESTSNATTTLLTVAIPANTLTTASQVRIEANFDIRVVSATCYYQVDIGNGSASTTVMFSAESGEHVSGTLYATSTSNFVASFRSDLPVSWPAMRKQVPLSYASTIYVDYRTRANINSGCRLLGQSIEVLK